MRLVFAAALVIAASAASADDAAPAVLSCSPGRTSMARVDLFFGASGSAAAWQRFLASVVTPRFPEGLTVLDGVGQWGGPHGLVHERSRVLVIYYRRNSTSDARIEAIRSLYKMRFRQASVLRADSTACVSF